MKQYKVDAQEYEMITARIYELLSPQCKVTHNHRLIGRLSKTSRQIDVSIIGNVSGHEIFIAVECKNQKSKVDINQVGAFYAMMQDVGAHRGVMISNSGFSKSAKNYAKYRGIDPCMIHDAHSKNWKLLLQVPLILEEILPSLNVSYTVYLEKDIPVPQGKALIVSGEDLRDRFARDWNQGAIQFDQEEQSYNPNYEDPFVVLQNDIKREIKDLKINVVLKRTYYFGYVDNLPNTKAIKNELTGVTQVLLSEADLASMKKEEMLLLKDGEHLPHQAKTHVRALMRPIIRDGEILKGQLSFRKIDD
ncbi:MAG: restriction endonuclease [Nitrospinae bacterium]|nr:restriction endonuclease [Nitrospinota bacterium]